MRAADKSIAVVGSKETIDFPDLGIFDVPAKVDTGADSSSVWASEVREDNGVLSFILFDKSSPYYTGKVLQTKKFKVAAIKNSFGHVEFRYKVTLKTRLAGRRLLVRFTLANRANNRLPILIGRRTLHGKFLVDVSHVQKKASGRLLLVSRVRTEAVEQFIAGIKARNDSLEVTYVTYDDIKFVFTDKMTKVVIAETGEDIATYDMVHFKTWKERDIPAAMAAYLQKRGVPFFDKRTMHFAANSKLYQYVLLGDQGVAVPPSIFVMPSCYDDAFDMFVSALGLPFVFKATQASRGDFNYLVRDRASYDKAVAATRAANVTAIAQKFIDNDGDYRVLVFGRHLALVIYRSRKDNTTHLNNTSQGGIATLVPVEQLPAKIRRASMEAVEVLELGVAGVDMVQDKRNAMWYCLEVNGDPQMASGAFTAEKQTAYAAYIANELNR